MDEARLVSRLLGFPATPPGLFFKAAPPADRGRLLTFGEAFRIASHHAEEAVAEAQIARAAAAQAADAEEARAACAAPAFEHLADAVGREVEALAASLRARGASPRAIATVDRIAGVNARQIGRARARLTKGGGHVPT